MNEWQIEPITVIRLSSTSFLILIFLVFQNGGLLEKRSADTTTSGIVIKLSNPCAVTAVQVPVVESRDFLRSFLACYLAILNINDALAIASNIWIMSNHD